MPVPRIRQLAITLAIALPLAGSLALGERLTRPDAALLEEALNAEREVLHPEGAAPGEQDHYPIDMRTMVERIRSGAFSTPPLDPAGVPWVLYKEDDTGQDDSVRHYNPVTVAQYALGLYEMHLHGDEKALADFLVQARWLKDRMTPEGRLEYRFDYLPRGLESGWISAMAQGEAISVLVRAHRVTSDAAFLDAARLAYTPLDTPVSRGGVLLLDGEDTWLEEYPQEPPSHVLNGHIFALWGVRDLHLATGEESIGARYDAAADTLARHLPEYERDGWLLYQLGEPGPARRQYYGLQLDQVRALALMTGDARFEEAARRWALPFEQPLVWRAGRAWARAVERVGVGR